MIENFYFSTVWLDEGNASIMSVAFLGGVN